MFGSVRLALASLLNAGSGRSPAFFEPPPRINQRTQFTPSNTRRGRQLTHGYRNPGRVSASRMPHIGVKEQERAARFYMEPYFWDGRTLRSTPIMLQVSPSLRLPSLSALSRPQR